MINLNHLRIFYNVAKHLSYTEAAKALFITQPAVTAQVKNFEECCGLKFFKKKGRKIVLTKEGQTLFEMSKKLFEYELEIENTLEEMKFSEKELLCVGSTKTYARYLMPTIVSSFHEAYPKIKIHLNEGSSLDIVQSLLNLKNEIAVVANVGVNQDKFNFIPFSMEELIVIVSSNNHLKQSKYVSVKELAKEPIIMKEEGSGTRKKVDELFATEKCYPNILIETSNTEFIKQLVEHNEGISFLVKSAVSKELENGNLSQIKLKEKKLYLDISVVYLKDQSLSYPANSFLDHLKSIMQNKEESGAIGSLIGKILAEQYNKW